MPPSNFEGSFYMEEKTKKAALSPMQYVSKCGVFCALVLLMLALTTQPVYATTTDVWTKANDMIVDLYNKIAGISTVLAALMSAVAVVGAKMSNNQHKVDQAWEWLRRIWIAWAVINGIGAFIAYIKPLFDGLNVIN